MNDKYDKRVIVVAGGAVKSDFLQANIDAEDMIIGADQGVVSLLDAGITPQIAIGDFDTTGKEKWKKWKSLGIEIIPLATMKDVTDTHAALEHALEYNPKEIHLFGAFGGGRMDHTLANISLLEWLHTHQVKGYLQDETNRIQLLSGPGNVHLSSNHNFDYVSIIPISKYLEKVSTFGLAYPLKEKNLVRGDSLGISNEKSEEIAMISAQKGIGLIIESKDHAR
ncbi:thiamine diphosphokinase [Shimazuella kribbensis]|uniref:thiamine diphosphokinase n=1 Tax=Shimazuella kribbensis TaxID=139808 RepID=UPI000413B7AF|nr:thiamine diphosphokinase [Shimazuella kribbensis]